MVDQPNISQPRSPVESSEPTTQERPVLCLSGGGFRATLFHLGAIRRLNDFGMLSRLGVITSVSGGSILNGVLATRWSQLTLGPGGVFTNLEEMVARPVEEFCRRDLRTPLLLFTRLNAFNWSTLLRDYFSVSANYLAQAYERLLPGCLGEVPAEKDQTPRFVFCATNVLTGACWHFHGGPGGRMGDFYAGYCDAQWVKVSEAVAASSAFTPGFSALRLRLPNCCQVSRIDPWGEHRRPTTKLDKKSDARTVILTDGGVYDNMGVEPLLRKFQVFLVSEAGRPFAAVPRNRQLITSRLQRAMDITIEQVGALRRRWLVDDFQAGRRRGAIWTIHTRHEDFPPSPSPGGPYQGYGAGVHPLICNIRTDLNAFSVGEVFGLENHGYALTDAAVRSRAHQLCPNPAAAFHWPAKDWLDEDKLKQALAGSDRRRLVRDVGRLIWRLGRS